MEGFLATVLSWLVLLATIVLVMVLTVASVAWRSREKKRLARRYMAYCQRAASRQSAPQAKT